MSNRRVVTSIIALSLSASAPVLARAASQAALRNEVFREKQITALDGRTQTHLEPARKLIPGEQVIYVLTYRNLGAKPAEGVVVNNPLPKGVEYAGPAESDPPLTSVDGGKTFGSLAQQQVQHIPDRPVPAAMRDVTALRWVIPGAVPPGAEVRLSYRARLD